MRPSYKQLTLALYPEVRVTRGSLTASGATITAYVFRVPWAVSVWMGGSTPPAAWKEAYRKASEHFWKQSLESL